MPQNRQEAHYPSLWALHVLVTAARGDESWDDVTRKLGMRTKHQVLRTVRRLEDRIGVRGLVVDGADGPYVPLHHQEFLNDVAGLLDRWAVAQDKARADSRTYFVRVNGYWSHVENFAAGVFGAFQPRGPVAGSRVRVELAPDFGQARDDGGAGLVEDLRDGKVDLVIAPDDRTAAADGHGDAGDSDPDDSVIRSVPLYRWALLAAVRPDHPLLEHVSASSIGPEDLVGYELLVSPSGHRTRDLLDLMRHVERRFVIAGTSPEPGALIALAHYSNRVAIVASDSALLKGPWATDDGHGLARGSQPGHWPALAQDGKVLGGGYRAYFRAVRSRTPQGGTRPAGLQLVLEQLATALRHRSAFLDTRITPWAARIEDCSDDYS